MWENVEHIIFEYVKKNENSSFEDIIEHLSVQLIPKILVCECIWKLIDKEKLEYIEKHRVRSKVESLVD